MRPEVVVEGGVRADGEREAEGGGGGRGRARGRETTVGIGEALWLPGGGEEENPRVYVAPPP